MPKTIEVNDNSAELEVTFYGAKNDVGEYVIKKHKLPAKISCVNRFNYIASMIDPEDKNVDPKFCRRSTSGKGKCLAFNRGSAGNNCFYLIENQTLEDFDGKKVKFSMSGFLQMHTDYKYRFSTTGIEILDVIPPKK